MKLKKNIIYNLDYIVCLFEDESDLYDSINYTLGPTVIIDKNFSNILDFCEICRNNNIEKIIFINYYVEYDIILNELKLNSNNIKFVFTKELSSLSNINYLNMFNKINDLYKSNKINSIAYIDKDIYNIFKKDKNIKHILLDIENNNKSNKHLSGIGILSLEDDTMHSFYNSLSAIKLNNDFANIEAKTKICKSFIKDFNIRYNIMNKNNIINKSEVNLYINFTDNNYIYFLKSMDNFIPCILGNQKIIERDNPLYNLITVKSDDNINEIAKKIDFVKKNKDKIFKYYKIFRENYSKESKELALDFIDNIERITNEESELLLSVIVPIYNVEKYLSNTIESILRAKIDSMEIILINDGSTDNSLKIAKSYEKNYPKLIKVINQTNHGLGNVRNVGLKNSLGKYIVSIDSDDTINPNFIIDAKKYMNNNIDVIIYDWKTINEIDNKEFYTNAKDKIFDNINDYKGLLLTTIMPSTCNKIIKKSLFIDNNLEYIEGLKYEDLSTNPIMLLKAKTIKYIPKPYYEYKIRDNSLMTSKINTDMIDILEILDKRLNEYKVLNKSFEDMFKCYTYSWRIEEFIINPLYELNNKELKTRIDYIYKKNINILEDLFKNDYYINKINSFPKDIKDYINKRNKSIINKELYEFIKNTKEIKKINAINIYYGFEE